MNHLHEKVIDNLWGREIQIFETRNAEGQIIKTDSINTYKNHLWLTLATFGRLRAIDFLSIILFSVQHLSMRGLGTFEPNGNEEDESLIIESWASEIKKAVSLDEIQAIDPITLLRLSTLPKNWDWRLSIEEADKFLVKRQMKKTCGEVIEFLLSGSKSNIELIAETMNPSLISENISDGNYLNINTTQQKKIANWHEEARKIADEVDIKNLRQNTNPSLHIIGDDVSKIMKEKGIADVSGSTVKREALQGDRWTRPRYKKDSGGLGV